jgi:hypothetical protein
MSLEIAPLSRRIERLERQNRRFKQLGLGLILSVGILLMAGAAKVPRTIEAEKIVLLDSQGRARITFSTPKTRALQLICNPMIRQSGLPIKTEQTGRS